MKNAIVKVLEHLVSVLRYVLDILDKIDSILTKSGILILIIYKLIEITLP